MEAAGDDLPPLPRNTVFQTSVISALLDGVYDGDLSLAELLAHGDFGLGTFNGLDGEMIILDGTAYQLHADGRDRRRGGHVLDYRATSGTLEVSVGTDLQLALPLGGASRTADLTPDDLDRQIERAEQHR